MAMAMAMAGGWLMHDGDDDTDTSSHDMARDNEMVTNVDMDCGHGRWQWH